MPLLWIVVFAWLVGSLGVWGVMLPMGLGSALVNALGPLLVWILAIGVAIALLGDP